MKMDVWNLICRTMLLQFLLINHIISSENQDNAFFNLTLTTNSPGLQYEILGEGKLCKSSWTINTFIDLKYLINSLSDIRSMLKTIDTYAINNTYQITINNLEKHLKKINLDIQVIRQMARYRKKVKRSFESGGSALQWMFGIADADDVRRYDSSINKLENDQKDMIHIVQDQVSILRSTITNFNETITTFNDNKLLFDKNIKKIETTINNINIELIDEKKQIIVLRLISLIENNIFELDIFVTRLQRMISNVQTNKLDVFIITPDQLLSEIKQIENILPENLQIPIKFNENNIQEIYKILHIDLHPMNDRIIFSIKIPLCIGEIFKLYYIIPIYVPINEHGQFIHIAENPTYLLTDDVVTKYFIWSNINNCLIVSDIFVCGFNEMLHNSDTDPTCVTEILKNSLTKPTQCDTYITEFKKELWYPSFFKNNWYFVCEKPTTITIICNNRSFIRKITLKSSGKLFLKAGCQAHTSKGVLITEQTVESSFATLPLELSILNDSCCNITLNQRYPKPIHLDEIKNLKFDKEAFLKIISKLNTQDELLNSILLNKTYEFVYTNKYLIIIIAVIILYASLKFCIKKKKNISALENINLGYCPVPIAPPKH